MYPIEMIRDVTGMGAFVLGVSWPFFHQRRAMIVGQAVTSSLFIVNFWLSGAQSGAAVSLLFVMQALLALPEERPKWALLLYAASLPAALAILTITWQGLPSVGAGFAITFATLSRWQTDAWRLRQLFYGVVLGWAFHNVLSGTWFGLAADGVALLTLTASIWRDRNSRR